MPVKGELGWGGGGEGLFRDKLAQTMQNKIITALRSRAKTLSEHKPQTDGTTLLNIVDAHLLYFCTNVLCQIGHNKPAHAREIEIRSKCRTAFAKLQLPDIYAQKPTHEKDNTQKPSHTVGYLYLIRTRACINARQSVYKIGKTRQSIHKRLNGYDKGAVIHCVFPVFGDVLDKLETTLIQAFDKRFTKRTDYGNEYFEGELMEMTAALTRVVCAKR